MAARVSVSASGQVPVNPALVSALGLGFVFFNQVLFWLLAILLARQTDVNASLNAGRFLLASLALASAVWLALAIFQRRAGVRRRVDGVVFAAAFFGIGAAWASGRPEFAVFANGLLAAWALRGLARKKVPGKK